MARVVRITDVEPFADGEVRWHPLRRELGVSAFGVNAFSGDAGDRVSGEHDEVPGAAGRHDELYVVVSGRATFTVDGEEIDASSGTLIQVAKESRRTAFAAEPGTVVLVVGGRPGEAFAPSPWEVSAQAAMYAKRGDTGAARECLAEALAGHPDHGHALYNVACAGARLGERGAALGHRARAVELEPRCREFAADDTDLDALRGDPAFPL